MGDDIPIRKSGFLTKQGEIVQSWKRRYCVLKGKKLFYYKEEAATKGLGKPKGVINLNIYKVKKVTNPEFCNKPNAFVLLPKDKVDRPYLLHADTDGEMQSWILELCKAIDSESDDMDVPSSNSLSSSSNNISSNNNNTTTTNGNTSASTTPSTPSKSSDSSTQEKRANPISTSLHGDDIYAEPPPKINANKTEATTATTATTNNTNTTSNTQSNANTSQSNVNNSASNLDKSRTEGETGKKRQNLVGMSRKKNNVSFADVSFADVSVKSSDDHSPNVSKSDPNVKPDNESKSSTDSTDNVSPSASQTGTNPWDTINSYLNSYSESAQSPSSSSSINLQSDLQSTHQSTDDSLNANADHPIHSSSSDHPSESSSQSTLVSPDHPDHPDHPDPSLTTNQTLSSSSNNNTSSQASDIAPITPTSEQQLINSLDSKNQLSTTNEQSSTTVTTNDPKEQSNNLVESKESSNLPESQQQRNNNDEKTSHSEQTTSTKDPTDISSTKSADQPSSTSTDANTHKTRSNTNSTAPNTLDSSVSETQNIKSDHLPSSSNSEQSQSVNSNSSSQKETHSKEEIENDSVSSSYNTTDTKSSSDSSISNNNNNNNTFWKSFFLQAEFDESSASQLTSIFEENQLSESDLADLDHDLLNSMKITVAKTRIKILKAKTKWIEEKEMKSKEASQESQIESDGEDETDRVKKTTIEIPVVVDVKNKAQKFEKKIQKLAQKEEPKTKQKKSP